MTHVEGADTLYILHKMVIKLQISTPSIILIKDSTFSYNTEIVYYLKCKNLSYYSCLKCAITAVSTVTAVSSVTASHLSQLSYLSQLSICLNHLSCRNCFSYLICEMCHNRHSRCETHHNRHSRLICQSHPLRY